MGRVVVIGGPSGSGKTTVGRLLERAAGWRRMITVTTRAPRPGERQGVDCHFLTPEEFRVADARGELGEKTVYVGNQLAYGIYHRDMEAAREWEGTTYAILDVRGLDILRNYYGGGVTGVFLWASYPILIERMVEGRGDQHDEAVRRLSRFQEEVATGYRFDHIIDTSDIDAVGVAVQVRGLVEGGLRRAPADRP